MNYLIVCSHKPYKFKYSSFYYPMQGGAINKESIGKDIIRDDSKDNISFKNPQYSELTTLYWAYKNLDYSILGLCHYRRYFKGKAYAKVNDRTIKVISEEECLKYLDNGIDVIVPKKRMYFIETLYNHYIRTLRSEPIIALEKVINKYYKDYVDEFNRLRKRRSAHMFNMMIGNKAFMDKYMPWLFGVLLKVEYEIDSSTWGTYDKRYMGSISELLLDIYINKNHIKYKEYRYIELIRFAKLRKAINYILIKFFKRRYKGSMK